MDDCKRCRGTGRIPDYLGGGGGETCQDCGGSGKSAVVPAPPGGWPLRVTLGLYATADGIRAALREAGIIISGHADELLGRIPLSEKRREVELVPVLDRDLGFDGSYTTRELLDRAVERGYGICPPEVSPLARLAYSGDEQFVVAMEPVFDSDGDPYVFGLNRGGGDLWLDARYASLDSQWLPSWCWLLVRRGP